MAQARRNANAQALVSAAKTPRIQPDWRRVAWLLHVSRHMDSVEETRLVPEKQVLYQFSARGHDLAQILLGQNLHHRHDAICGYYRSRPILLSVGVPLDEALAGPLARAGGYSDGRDIGVVFNYPNANGPSALPMCGGVGAQYTPAVGWAQAIEYRRKTLGDAAYDSAISVALGGDASVATNGFWAALTIATTQQLPMLFYIEDNGFGISVRSNVQTPGGNIAANLAAFQGLSIYEGDGTNPAEAARLTQEAVAFVREQRAPALLRLTVPRLSGHSAQDTQGYKSDAELAEEKSRDPLGKLKDYLVPDVFTEETWEEIGQRAARDVETALEAALARPLPSPENLTRHVFSEAGEFGITAVQKKGGLAAEGHTLPRGRATAQPEGPRINMAAAIRRTLEEELAVNPKMLVFGEDVGPKGGVHSVTAGLQAKFGEARVFDTSLSEEGIIGRAVGMALAGLMPVPEIQFRKYADPACEQLNDCGTLRWRTHNRFAAPMVVRMPGGFFKCGDPWHSQTNEVQFVHAIGWRVAVPSNAEDAVGLLRASLRGNDPVIFFEHRAMLDHGWARRPWPGSDFVLPFGKAKTAREGRDITVVTWGAMVERCEQAADRLAQEAGRSVEVIDLRTLSPWDSEAVIASVRRTHRCLVVHEDNGTAGFGAEILATVGRECFLDLDAPLERLTMPDIPSPHNPVLLNAAVPSAEGIAAKISEMLRF